MLGGKALNEHSRFCRVVARSAIIAMQMCSSVRLDGYTLQMMSLKKPKVTINLPKVRVLHSLGTEISPQCTTLILESQWIMIFTRLNSLPAPKTGSFEVADLMGSPGALFINGWVDLGCGEVRLADVFALY